MSALPRDIRVKPEPATKPRSFYRGNTAGRDAPASETAAINETEQTASPSGEQLDTPRAALTLAHETDMPDTDEFSDETGLDGADNAVAARASALRAILVEGFDAQRAEWRIKKHWPRLKEDAAKIVASAQRTAEKWKPGTWHIIGGMQKEITSVEAINERFVLLAAPARPSCIAQIEDALPMTREDFASRLDEYVIVTSVSAKGEVQTSPAAKVWLGDRRRRKASKIVFTSRKVGPECFNLWTGFGVTPEAGKCDLIYRHIHEVICAGRNREYKALLDLIAWQAQNIGRSSRIVVDLFSTEQQVGKGVLLEKVLLPMFGLHGLFTAESGNVFGRFNDAVRGKAYIAFDEAAFAGDRQLADKIKSAAATETTSIEGKGVPVITCPTAVNYYMATNHPHSAHVEWDDARYWILRVSKRRKGDLAYWAALFREIEEGGVEAFLHDMLSRDVSNFTPSQDVPRDNSELRENKRASDPANPAIWLLDCIENGLWLGSENWQGAYSLDGLERDAKGALPFIGDERILPAFLETSYRAWARASASRAQPATKNEFWKQLSGFGFDRHASNGKRYRIVPEAEKLRAKVVEYLGGEDDDGAETEGDWTDGGFE